MQRLTALFLFLCFILQGATLFAQRNYHPSFNTVISPDGLNIRRTPSLKGWKLAAAPFGMELVVLDSGNGVVETLETRYYKDPDDEKPYPVEVSGTWVKVKYGDVEGYVFSAFLYPNWERVHYKGINEDYVLLMPGMNCFNNIHFLKGRNYYGIYKTGTSYSVRKIPMPGYFASTDDISPLHISANNNRDLVLIVGSRKPLPIGQLKGQMYGIHGSTESQLYEGAEGPGEALTAHDLHVKTEKRDEYEVKVLHYGEEGNTTSLGSDQIELSYPNILVYKGDLDGDREDDLIVLYGEKSAQIGLYLSSEAEDGEKVKLVAIYLLGYCC